MYTDSSTSEVEAKRAGGLVTTEPGLTNQCTSQAQATVQSSVASGKHTIGHFNAPGAVVNMHTALPLNITLLLPSSGPVTVKTSVAQGDVRGVYWVLPPLTIYPTTMFCASISSNTGNCPAGMVKSADYTSKTCAQDPCASTDCCVTAVLQGGWVRTNKNCGVSSNNTLGVEYELECLAFGKDLKTVQRRKFLSHLKTCALGTFNYREYQGMAVSDYVASTTVNMTSYFRYRYDMKSILVFAASDKSVFDLNHPVSGCPCGRTWKLNEQRTIVFADCPVGSCPRALEDWAVPAYGSHFLNTTDATIARTFEYPTATSWTFSKLNAHYVKVVDVNHPCYAADAALGYDLDPFPMCPNSLVHLAFLPSLRRVPFFLRLMMDWPLAAACVWAYCAPVSNICL